MPVKLSGVAPISALADSVPTTVGIKFTVTKQEPFTATLEHVLLVLKSTAFVPVRVTAPNVPIEPPLLVTTKV